MRTPGDGLIHGHCLKWVSGCLSQTVEAHRENYTSPIHANVTLSISSLCSEARDRLTRLMLGTRHTIRRTRKESGGGGHFCHHQSSYDS